MKPYIFILFITLIYLGSSTRSQAQIFGKVKEAAKETIEGETEKETKKKTKDVMDGIFGNKKKDKKKEKDNQKNSGDKIENANSSTKIVSGSEFFPNGQTIFFEQFDQDNVGDFPINWLTDVGGEIIMANQNKALYIYDDAQVILDVEPLPENCAIEFDFITQNLHGISDDIYIQLTSEKTFGSPSSGGSVKLLLSNSKGHNNSIEVENWGKDIIKIENNPALSFWKFLEKTTHVTIVKNGNRFRFYLDNQKILDLPSFLGDESGKYLRIKRENLNADGPDEIVAFSNLKITKEVKDIRSQLLKGSLTTNQILFETGSSEIQPKSEDILNTIGNVLENHSDKQYLIIGHTDNVGEEAENRSLSKSRAQAVVDYISDNFKITDGSLISVGKGESEPIASNDTEAGKQKNRRVQFKKL